MEYLAIIQARMNSTRLPGKVLMPLNGKPVLQHVIERVSKSKCISEVSVVTGIGLENLPIQALCASLGVRCFAGNEEDVLDRFFQLAKLLNPDRIVRVTADCPCYDAGILDQAISAMCPQTDYLSDFNETLPDGYDIEVFRFSALHRAWREATLLSEREHVTLYIKNHPELFYLQNFQNPYGSYGHLRLTLDEKQDYVLISALYDVLNGSEERDFQLGDVLAFLAKHPEYANINKMHGRNEGLTESLRNDEKAKSLTERNR